MPIYDNSMFFLLNKIEQFQEEYTTNYMMSDHLKKEGISKVNVLMLSLATGENNFITIKDLLKNSSFLFNQKELLNEGKNVFETLNISNPLPLIFQTSSNSNFYSKEDLKILGISDDYENYLDTIREMAINKQIKPLDSKTYENVLEKQKDSFVKLDISLKKNIKVDVFGFNSLGIDVELNNIQQVFNYPENKILIEIINKLTQTVSNWFDDIDLEKDLINIYNYSQPQDYIADFFKLIGEELIKEKGDKSSEVEIKLVTELFSVNMLDYLNIPYNLNNSANFIRENIVYLKENVNFLSIAEQSADNLKKDMIKNHNFTKLVPQLQNYFNEVYKTLSSQEEKENVVNQKLK